MKILIVGAGVAGPTLAYWLAKDGHEVTVVERREQMPKSGYMIDFWGVGYDVAEKMGVLDALRERSHPISEVTFVGEKGERKSALKVSSANSALQGRMMSLLRSDLADVLYEKSKATAEYRFSTMPTAMTEATDGVSVTFSDGKEEKFDLVFGADGLHSKTRRYTFTDLKSPERYLGYGVCSFTIDNFLPEDFDNQYSMYSKPNRQVATYTMGDKLVSFFLFREPDMHLLLQADAETQKSHLARTFGSCNWVTSKLLDSLKQCEEFYFDGVYQVHMDTWHQGRVTLVGDSCFCPSLLSGQGSALSMAGAYLLAGELKSANGDYEKAFVNYEKRFATFVEGKQQMARKFIRSFIPSTEFGIWFRNQFTKVMNIPFIANWYWKSQMHDKLSLPNYD